MAGSKKQARRPDPPGPTAPDHIVIAFVIADFRFSIDEKRESTNSIARRYGLPRETLLAVASGAPVHRGTISILRDHLRTLAEHP